jgi:methylmalonyl-CoA mutase cobalamin-binding subunit
MAITLKPEQEQVLMEAIHSGLAQTPEEALDQALESLKSRLPQQVSAGVESVASVAHRLATFGKRHGLSLGGMTIQELLRESRP